MNGFCLISSFEIQIFEDPKILRLQKSVLYLFLEYIFKIFLCLHLYVRMFYDLSIQLNIRFYVLKTGLEVYNDAVNI